MLPLLPLTKPSWDSPTQAIFRFLTKLPIIKLRSNFQRERLKVPPRFQEKNPRMKQCKALFWVTAAVCFVKSREIVSFYLGFADCENRTRRLSRSFLFYLVCLPASLLLAAEMHVDLAHAFRPPCHNTAQFYFQKVDDFLPLAPFAANGARHETPNLCGCVTGYWRGGIR